MKTINLYFKFLNIEGHETEEWAHKTFGQAVWNTQGLSDKCGIAGDEIYRTGEATVDSECFDDLLNFVKRFPTGQKFQLLKRFI